MFPSHDRGRRLGTVDDGTSLRSNPQLGVDPDFNDSTTEHFTTNTRDITLKRSISIKFRTNAFPITIRGTQNRYGYAYCGPTMNTINRFALSHFTGSGGRAVVSATGGASDSTVTTSISPLRIDNLADFRLTGTYNTSLDGEIVQLGDIATDRLKTNLALPTEITEKDL